MKNGFYVVPWRTITKYHRPFKDIPFMSVLLELFDRASMVFNVRESTVTGRACAGGEISVLCCSRVRVLDADELPKFV
jgi:hypothetical protein